MKNILLFFLCSLVALTAGFAQKKQQINLLEAHKQGKLSVFHRQINPLEEGDKKGVRVSQEREEGLAWLKGIKFSEGTIEFDVRGQDVFQQSFVGVAFHAQNDSTYDAIYFRPFNFYAKDSVRYIHAVQYVAHPSYPWKKLRDERNAQFEKAIPNAPNPNEWFHAKVVVKGKSVQVFVNDRKEAVLTVEKLSTFSKGQIGLFVGDGSGGDFANLVIHKNFAP
ncbi:MAG: family 16 glycoside hydrolase [Haliscomenobacter sp.]|uniref:family 16 glycoside hydrolase n=1 Tax=Haliscomenobacter sp. TaxID=2717303 RepID=UPI0029A23E91|nr:family 16 glycoside hydrolase [Haliscomenobacter sp.]MDX2070506.1 family 16 glycoside hydrolase [Haliscomenobacter sp.]